MALKRPRCDYCGKKIYPMSRPWSNVDHLIGDAPMHCPNCGKELSREKRNNVDKYGVTIFLFQCCCGISVIASIIIIILLTTSGFL